MADPNRPSSSANTTRPSLERRTSSQSSNSSHRSQPLVPPPQQPQPLRLLPTIFGSPNPSQTSTPPLHFPTPPPSIQPSTPSPILNSLFQSLIYYLHQSLGPASSPPREAAPALTLLLPLAPSLTLFQLAGSELEWTVETLPLFATMGIQELSPKDAARVLPMIGLWPFWGSEGVVHSRGGGDATARWVAPGVTVVRAGTRVELFWKKGMAGVVLPLEAGEMAWRRVFGLVGGGMKAGWEVEGSVVCLSERCRGPIGRLHGFEILFAGMRCLNRLGPGVLRWDGDEVETEPDEESQDGILGDIGVSNEWQAAPLQPPRWGRVATSQPSVGVVDIDGFEGPNATFNEPRGRARSTDEAPTDELPLLRNEHYDPGSRRVSPPGIEDAFRNRREMSIGEIDSVRERIRMRGDTHQITHLMDTDANPLSDRSLLINGVWFPGMPDLTHRVSHTGEHYFADFQSTTTTWTDPRVNRILQQMPLANVADVRSTTLRVEEFSLRSTNWTHFLDVREGHHFFYDSETFRSTFQDPRYQVLSGPSPGIQLVGNQLRSRQGPRATAVGTWQIPREGEGNAWENTLLEPLSGPSVYLGSDDSLSETSPNQIFLLQRIRALPGINDVGRSPIYLQTTEEMREFISVATLAPMEVYRQNLDGLRRSLVSRWESHDDDDSWLEHENGLGRWHQEQQGDPPRSFQEWRRGDVPGGIRWRDIPRDMRRIWPQSLYPTQGQPDSLNPSSSSSGEESDSSAEILYEYVPERGSEPNGPENREEQRREPRHIEFEEMEWDPPSDHPLELGRREFHDHGSVNAVPVGPTARPDVVQFTDPVRGVTHIRVDPTTTASSRENRVRALSSAPTQILEVQIVPTDDGAERISRTESPLTGRERNRGREIRNFRNLEELTTMGEWRMRSHWHSGSDSTSNSEDDDDHWPFPGRLGYPF
ncbi:MAG: hypothetical protein M1814_006250 [Vezdaea aestivalis]|nr:MAG: hypothetical protein M1814_006250 [Vezdaea aestivalis]